MKLMKKRKAGKIKLMKKKVSKIKSMKTGKASKIKSINKKVSKIKVVAFDVGGVLSLGRFSLRKMGRVESRGVHEFVARELGVGVDTWFDAIDTFYARSIEGRFTKKEVLKIISENLKVNSSRLENVLSRAYEVNFKRNKKLYDFAFDLKKQGFKIMILSDQWPVSREVLIKKDDEDVFDYSIVSCDVGMRKPDRKIFNLALKRARIKAREMVFIDNRDWNTVAAEKLGIKSVLFENNSQAIRDVRRLIDER